MGLFSRRQRQGPSPIIPVDTASRLADVGRVVFRDGQLGVDVSGFYLPGFMSEGAPSPGTVGWDDFTDRFLRELLDWAGTSEDWSIAGALYVAKDFVATEDHVKPGFVEIVERALEFLADARVSTAVIPMFALSRWTEIKRSRQ